MDAAVKTRWLEALRSGKYAQCRGQLEKTGREGEKSFCCLGVLSEIAGYPQKANGSQYLDPKASGLESWVQDTLSRLNDSDGKDFNFIADYIEKEVA